MSIWPYKLVIGILLANLLLVLYIASVLHDSESDTENFAQARHHSSHDQSWLGQSIHVEIWSKAAIGQYVWENILRGSIDKRHENALYIEGSTQIENVTFKFRSGPSLKVQSLLSFAVPNLVLILNWRSQEKINYSLPWLEAIQAKEEIHNVGLIALGNEQCNNQWFLEYLRAASGKIKFLFVVYDWDQVDNERIFQWPLGLATYRNFPPSKLSSLSLQTNRPYLCNYIATIYPNSSRQELASFFESHPKWRARCLLKVRSQWQPQETEHSMEYYVEALKLSHLTLSPVGHNHECYRILEAVEYGSLPVIELNGKHRRRKGSSCDETNALRLFQELEAPFIYVQNWTQQLPDILAAQEVLSGENKARQRAQLIKWYHRFKNVLRNRLVTAIHDKFT